MKTILIVFCAVFMIGLVSSNAAIYDDFNDNSLDVSKWEVETDAETAITEVGGRIELSILPAASGDDFGADIESTLMFTGDFDIQVAFSLVSWPTDNGVRSSLGVQSDSGSVFIERSASSPLGYFPERYNMNGDGDGLLRGIIPTSDDSGKLRIQRLGDVITGYYFDTNAGWQVVSTYTSDEVGFDPGESLSLYLSVWSHDSPPFFNPGGKPITIAFDNINITGCSCGFGSAEIIGAWDNGIWYWDVAESKWIKMASSTPTGDIAAGDFTGDGKADVASCWSNGLWYQDGATLDWTKVSNTAPTQVTAGDVTGDGRDEIIGTWSNGIWYWDVAAFKWTQMAASTPTGDIAAGDFTGDGKADVASCWRNGLWYQDGASLGWTKVSNTAPTQVTAGNVTGDSMLGSKSFATTEVKLLASDGVAYDNFGYSVSISDRYAIVGTYLDDDSRGDSGSAYIFERSGSSWNQVAKLTAEDAAADDRFGENVSISGGYAIVGARFDDDYGVGSGSAYIFKRNGSSWNQMTKLTAEDAAAGDWFGESVSISGNLAIVGADLDDDNGVRSGSAYIFERSGNSWNQVAKLIAGDGAADDRFGWSVSISGGYAIVGAFEDDDNGGDSGSAYIFERSGSSWNQVAKLTADDGAAGDWFGLRVSISGGYAIVGAFGNDDDGQNSGSAYIFERNGSSWNQVAKLTAGDGAAYDRFGWSVSISGGYAIVGAYLDDDNGQNSGSTYIFEKSGYSWVQVAKLTASDGAFADSFGVSVSISGNFAIVGATGNDDNGSNSGSAYIYDFSLSEEIIGTWSNGIWYYDVATSEWTQMNSSSPTGDIAAGDFTGDGKADVASCWSNGLWYQDGATLDWTKVSNTAPTQLTAGDVTGN